MDKLEKHIKDKLEGRHITPSPGSWDRIASQLPNPRKKKSGKWYPYAIAASFLGALMVSYLLLTPNGAQEIQTQVVEEVPKVEMDRNSDSQNSAITDQSSDFNEVEVVKTEVKPSQDEQENRKNFSEELLVAKSEVVENRTIQPLKDRAIQESNALISQKVEEVVAQVQLLEDQHNGEVTDAEVDSLLRRAQRQILTDKLFTKTGSVDAMSLLAEVEDELDETFRDQIFDALKDGYLKLRTAVADRNN